MSLSDSRIGAAKSGESHYPARDVLAYLQRLSASAGNATVAAPSPSQASSSTLAPQAVVELKIELKGIAAWMNEAGPNDTWSFSIQKNGRPMDFATAITFGKLTGNAERLTLREFGTRLADAAAIDYISDESDEIRAVVAAVPLPLPTPAADPKKEEKPDWI